MSEAFQEEKKSKGTGGYIAIILVLLIGIGGLVFYIAKKKGELNECQTQNYALQEDMQGMNAMFSDYGVMINDDVKSNLKEMLAQYDDMESNNIGLKDSIQAEKAKIMSLLAEAEQADVREKGFMRKIYKLNKENETLRSVMKNYLTQIDELNTENKGLKTDLKTTGDQLTQVTDERDMIEDKANEYAEKIKVGSKLQAYGIVSEGIKVKSSGSFKETSRANYTDQIRACFTLSKNSIAAAGNKTIYMQVISPAGKGLYERSANTIKLDAGGTIIYSDKKTINYQKAAIDVCIFYDLNGEKAEKGNYTVKIFADGAQIGSDTFVLK